MFKTKRLPKAISTHVSLVRGNCLKKLSELPSNSIDLVLTDLPYGTTNCPWDTVIDLEKMWRELYRVGREDCVFVFTAQSPFTFQLAQSNPYGFKHLRHTLVWEKSNGSNPLNARVAPMKAHEDILVFCRKGARYNPQMEAGAPYKGGTRYCAKGEAAGMSGKIMVSKDNAGTRFPRSVQFFPWERGWHPTQKPVSLMSWLVRTYSNPGQTVLDLTMGSGSTGVSAVREGRDFIGYELDSTYMAIARKRIQAALAGEPDPKPVPVKKSKTVAASRQTLRGGRGYGAARRKGVEA